MSGENEYPTDEDLQRITDWPFDDLDACLEFVQSIWHWPDFGIAKENGVLYLATGGWSGNESIISAMLDNIGLHCRWICSSRGGAHEFELDGKHDNDRETRFRLERELIKLKATPTPDMRLREALEALVIAAERFVPSRGVIQWERREITLGDVVKQAHAALAQVKESVEKT